MLIGGLVGFSMMVLSGRNCSGWLPRSVLVSVWFAGNFRQLYLWSDYPVRKTIRIGDTVTIRDLTGSVTKIKPAPPPSATGTVKR